MNQIYKATLSQYALPPSLPSWGDLEGWSRDPMFEKYPSISPYTYCANNPVMFVDPTGMDYIVKITGLLANEATDQLKQSAPNLNITRNEETGELKASGKAQTQYEQQVLDAINDPNIEVNITAENTNITPDGADFHGGAFLGTEFIFNASTDEYITSNKPFIIEELPLPGVKTNQLVNPVFLEKLDRGTGKGMIHEVTESYELGKLSIELGRSIKSAMRTIETTIDGTTYETKGSDYNWYQYIHYKKATPIP